jgi:hypothetical protein
MGTFALIVLMVTQEDNVGKVATAAVKALFFKNVRLLSIGVSLVFEVITVCFDHV